MMRKSMPLRGLRASTSKYYLPIPLLPQSHQTTGPVRFLSPVRFLARKAEWSARRNFTFSWSHQATGPVRLDTAVHIWLGRMIRGTPWVPVRASCGPRKGIYNVFHILRDPCGTRAGPARMPTTPFGTRKGIDTTRVDKKSRTGVLFGRTGGGGVRALAVPARLFTGCLGYQNPYGP